MGGFQRLTDYDIDDDGLIDVNSLPKLDAIRYDLDGNGTATDDAYDDAFLGPMANMGCPASGCTGYELTADLDFDQNGDDSITSADTAYWNGGAGWAPIGDNSNRFAAVFEGNGRTISNLFISRGAADYVGLFGATASGGGVRNVGVADAQVQGRNHVGALVGNNLGRVSASWATGSVTSTDDSVGGLVGSSEGVIAASYSAASVRATGSGSNNTGGLVGLLSGANASILASYATGSVSGNHDVGGLVGAINTGVITASYSTGAVSGNDDVGGLVGVTVNGTITASYWDTVRSEQSLSDGGTGKTGAELRAPTGYSGIYAGWNLDLDGDSANDNPWDFGANYNYPTLRGAGGKQKGPGPVSGVTAAPSHGGNLVVTWDAPTDYGDGNPGNADDGRLLSPPQQPSRHQRHMESPPRRVCDERRPTRESLYHRNPLCGLLPDRSMGYRPGSGAHRGQAGEHHAARPAAAAPDLLRPADRRELERARRHRRLGHLRLPPAVPHSGGAGAGGRGVGADPLDDPHAPRHG